MSAKDLRSFVTKCHDSNAERMVRRASAGIACTSFKPVDYGQLKNMIAEKKFTERESLMKLEKVEAAARRRKDENSLKQHLNVWNRELTRLSALRRQIEVDIESSVYNNLFDNADLLYEDLMLYHKSLDKDFSEFKKQTCDPIWLLRADLKVWMKTYNTQRADKSVELDEPDNVLATIDAVKQQQENILQILSSEQSSLETELHIRGLLDPVVNYEVKEIQTGIPEEAFDFECPDMQFKAEVLQQFILLDGKYVEKLNELEQVINEIMSELFDGWTNKEHAMFVYIVDKYTREITTGRWILLIDCMLRCLSHKSRADIVKHEQLWSKTRFFNQMRKDLLSSWTRDRSQLLYRVKTVFNEAFVWKQLQDEKLENRQKQQEFCDFLSAKVNDWHQRKMEAFKLEQELAEAENKRAEAAREAEEQKEKMKRQHQKEKIQKFRSELEEKQKLIEDEKRRRLKELETYFAEQASHDKERVKFREVEMMKKQEEVQKKKEELREAAEEKERVLEAIRAKVRPDVECDLLRLWSDTQAWQARHRPEEHIDIQKPLFDITSFTSERIMADPRVRVEQRIREAGLQHNDYARQVLLQMQPTHHVRRDMESTLFR